MPDCSQRPVFFFSRYPCWKPGSPHAVEEAHLLHANQGVLSKHDLLLLSKVYYLGQGAVFFVYVSLQTLDLVAKKNVFLNIKYKTRPCLKTMHEVSGLKEESH